MRIPIRALTLLVTCAFCAVGDRKEKIAKDLPSTKNVNAIVQFHQPLNNGHLNRLLGKGAKLLRRLDSIRGAAVTVPAAALGAISEDDEVRYLSPERKTHPTLDYTTVTAGANLAWSSGYAGAGVSVAVIDSGIQDHPDLAGQIVYRESFTGLNSTLDTYGHGVHVSGIIASTGATNGAKYKGVAPGAKIVALRVLGDEGEGSDSMVIAAIQRAIELKNTYNIRVINLSLGRQVWESYTLDPLAQAAAAAWDAGIVVVTAAGNMGRYHSAGNEGYGTILSPGNHPKVITVGAMNVRHTTTRGDDIMTSYSSKGPTPIDFVVKPDLVAPGNRVVSMDGLTETKLARDYPGNKLAGNYLRLNGTSMAAPVVAGAAALLLQKTPSHSPSASALSPSAQFDPATGTVRMVQGSGVIWGSGIIWGTGVVGGSSAVDSAGVVWGSGVVWGTAA
jgi:serine protease AprX